MKVKSGGKFLTKRGTAMKKRTLITMGTAAVVLFLAGCASTARVSGPVGPDPAEVQLAAPDGQLEVYSAPSGQTEGNNPTWFQYSDYYIYDHYGRRLEHVDNSRGYYSKQPSIINLPPGKYIIEARAKGTLQARVPVVIKAGETTRVHLDGNWQPPADAPAKELVSGPEGYPVGWRAR